MNTSILNEVGRFDVDPGAMALLMETDIQIVFPLPYVREAVRLVTREIVFASRPKVTGGAL